MSPEARSPENGSRGGKGRRTWSLLATTAPSKRFSAAWTRSATSGVLLWRSFAFSLRGFQVCSCPLVLQSPTKLAMRIAYAYNTAHLDFTTAQMVINRILCLLHRPRFTHSFIADIYIAPLQWDYSEALPAPARPNNVFKLLKEFL